MQLFRKKQKKQVINPSLANNPSLEKVYTDAAGRGYYKYTNELELPPCRALMAERAARYAELFITRDIFSECMKQIKEAAKENDLMKAFAIIYEMDNRHSFLGEEESLLELASCYFLREDEIPLQPSQKIIDEKLMQWRNEPEARNFFLNAAFRLTKSYLANSLEDVREYLEANSASAKRLTLALSRDR